MVGILVGGGGIKLFKMWRKREEWRATTAAKNLTNPSAPATDMNELEEEFHHQLSLEEHQQQAAAAAFTSPHGTGKTLLTPQMFEMQQQQERVK